MLYFAGGGGGGEGNVINHVSSTDGVRMYQHFVEILYFVTDYM